METYFSLLPCPFCGKTESVYIRGMSQMIGDQLDDGLNENYTVACVASLGGCGASGGYADSECETVSKWNMRKEL